MDQPALWSSVESFFAERLLGPDPALDATLAASSAAGLPAIQVSPTEGKFLHLLARILGARRILEVGTLGGYSAIWMARALAPGGRLITLEISAAHAKVAEGCIARAGLGDRVDVVVGPASESLTGLIAERVAPFDLIFIDADKARNPEYFLAALQLSHVGTVIVVDNVVRRGTVVESDSVDADVQGVRRLVELVARETRVSATALQTVGSKGHDGFMLALVTSLT